MQEEPVSEDLEEAADKYSNHDYNYFDVLVTEYDGKEHLMDDKEFIKDAFKAGANWQKVQDMKYGYITALQGEKRFAHYILEMIANGWHIEAIKTACNDKIKEDEQ